MTKVTVSGNFDNIQLNHIRILHEAAKIGSVQLQVWSDEVIRKLSPQSSLKFPISEQLYFLKAIRYVDQVQVAHNLNGSEELDLSGGTPDFWAFDESQASATRLSFCTKYGIKPIIIKLSDLAKIPNIKQLDHSMRNSGRKKIIVTGCYDWLHSGHVRFFEEVSELGELIVAVGHDANIRLLKGEGHPLFPAEQRRFMVQSGRYVTEAIITTGTGWMDAAPEIEKIRPQAYAVNEDGDKPEKKAFCQKNGLEYIVLKREPKAGLPKRQSTDLRGF